MREIGFQGVQPLGGLPRPEDRHGDDLLAEVAQGGGEVADVVGDAVPLGVGLALHHGDAHGAIFPAWQRANGARVCFPDGANALRRGRRTVNTAPTSFTTEIARRQASPRVPGFDFTRMGVTATVRNRTSH